MYETVNQTTTYTNFSYYSVQHLPAQIPNPHFQSLSSDNSVIHPPNSATFLPQSSHYSDPNPISPAIQPLRKEAVASAGPGTSMNNKLIGQSSHGKVSKRKPMKPKVISNRTSVSQSVWCNLCKIECNSIQHYEKHLSGKKHNKCIKNMYASTILSAQQSSQSSYNTSGSGTSVGQGKPDDLEAKKQKLLEGGTAAEFLRVCSICNVACNGEIAFSDHLVGKKHIAQERALSTKMNPSSTSVSNPGTNSQKTNVVAGAPWCEICKISCTSIEGLVVHRIGKKHKKNLEKLRNSISDMADPSSSSVQVVSTSMPTEVVDNAEAIQGTVMEAELGKKKGARLMEPDDLEAKKQKVLESGAAADAVRTCAVCNVVCNSETVFIAHLSGQKHASMIKQALLRAPAAT